MEPFACLAWAWVNELACSRERVGITAELGPGSPHLLTPQGILLFRILHSFLTPHLLFFLLRNPGDRMGSAPTNCCIFNFFPAPNCAIACLNAVLSFGSTTGYGINE